MPLFTKNAASKLKINSPLFVSFASFKICISCVEIQYDLCLYWSCAIVLVHHITPPSDSDIVASTFIHGGANICCVAKECLLGVVQLSKP